MFVIAGPNGAGETTFAREFLPKFADCPNFVNVDLIAGGLSPFKPQTVALAAGKLMLNQIYDLVRRRENFGFETTLSGKRYLQLLRDFQEKRYVISLFFLWLPNIEMAIQRVKDRVKLGGHNVEDADVRRRFSRGLRNFHLYKDIVDQWQIINGSANPPVSLAYGQKDAWKCEDEALETTITNIVTGRL